MKQSVFIQKIWDFYHEHGRSFEWRNDITPYRIVVSEIMLQQTQTSRVREKFPQFLSVFPDFYSLSQATLLEVLQQWQGLGYNRRGKFLHEIAKKVVIEFGGTLPQDPIVLETFPGIGKNTAGSVCAFAFNLPVPFIETNIRRVYIHEFFQDSLEVHDKELMPLIEQTMSKENPREWYYALMDYGAYLKTQIPNPNRKSKHYTIQSKFEGSNRQVRSTILAFLLKEKSATIEVISKLFPATETRVFQNLQALQAEGFIVFDGLEVKVCE
jgi:A/G-specific adenine glycosylase